MNGDVTVTQHVCCGASCPSDLRVGNAKWSRTPNALNAPTGLAVLALVTVVFVFDVTVDKSDV